ncbi:MAG: hypothetical protein A3G76_06395 [Acidobacteria bacterium RIFCSPLOWO2_12_FULL_65_11]|nr:MAG: hypothetical protein A3H95_10315 [Acidobacteria bacterium RIFCSPLOWO2_02_FULL_64_15]OFW28012.1 MAG: hypothetical protein A3G76_06395 [Acidobacteria bacterium RIFCSPLOWO2_12_FULL_65_11]
MKKLSRPQVLGVLVTAVVIAAVAVGISLIGSPAEERARRMDERRVQDLASMARAVDLYWTRHASLPESLDGLRKEPGGNVRFTDPSTSDPYEYRPLEAETYELCARFERDSGEAGRPTGDAFWSHGAGRQCFQRETRKVP